MKIPVCPNLVRRNTGGCFYQPGSRARLTQQRGCTLSKNKADQVTLGGQGDSFEHFSSMNSFMPPAVHVSFKIYAKTPTFVGCVAFVLLRKGPKGQWVKPGMTGGWIQQLHFHSSVVRATDC